MKGSMKCECGLFGIHGDPNLQAVNTVHWGLRDLQSRGQESAGIATPRDQYVAMGLVRNVLTAEVLGKFAPAATAIGHTRYSTTGSSVLCNAQPLIVQTKKFGKVVVAMNGNVINARELGAVLEVEARSEFQTTTDAEILAHLIDKSPTADFDKALAWAVEHLQGGFCYLVLHGDNLYAVRDRNGFRPLCVGERNGATVFASESVAFDHPEVRANYLREVQPGEIICCRTADGYCLSPWPTTREWNCVFEHVYFARPDGKVFGRPVAMSRELLGAELAGEDNPLPGAIVVGVPDSGIPAAFGYGKASDLRVVPALTRDHYIGRTFLDPNVNERTHLVELKLRAIRHFLKGAIVVIVDDSIVRGNTMRIIVSMVRKAGAREVHVRITCPPTRYPCFYGVDTPTRRELIASNKTPEETCEFIGADSLLYLSPAGMHRACGQEQDEPPHQCDACFTGNYPPEHDELVQIRLHHPPEKQ